MKRNFAILLVHLSGIVLVLVTLPYILLPYEHVSFVSEHIIQTDYVRTSSWLALAIHVALSLTIWATIQAVVRVLTRLKPSRKVNILRATGSVMTETLIVLPVFLLLTFGMAQLSINNIAGILANVAAYEAARSAWVWRPEESATTKRMGVEDGIAEEKARIAIALVMTPVAPGDYISDPQLDDFAEKMRNAAVMSHIPFGGTASNLFGDLIGMGTGALSVAPTRAVEGNRSFWKALDGSDFITRTARKFTHAYHASSVEFGDDGAVTTTYKLHIAMPLVGPVFGEEDSIWNLSTGVGFREGYFSTFTREYSFPAQVNLPNGFLPNNELDNFTPPPSGEGAAEGGIDGQAGGVPDADDLPDNNPPPPDGN